MAKVKISGLPAGGALNGTELVPIVQSGTTKRITAQDIANLGNASGVEGSGTINYLAKFTATSTIGNSLIFDNGTSIGINTATPSATYRLDVNGNGRFKHADTPIRLDNAGGNITQLDFLNNGTQKAAMWWNNSANTLNLFSGVTALSLASTGAATFSSNVSMSTFAKISSITPYLELRDTNWAASTFVQTGVNVGATASGDYFNIYNPAGKGLSYVRGGVVDFMISPAGNVGIGTSSPRAKFSVISGTDNTGAFFPATNALIVGSDNSLASNSPNLAISSNSPAGIDVGASIGFGGLFLSPGDLRDLGFGMIKGAKETADAGNAQGYLAFGTYGSGGMAERMRITSAGNVLIGTTTDAGFKLDVNGSGRFNGNLSVNGNVANGTQIKLFTSSVSPTNANGFVLGLYGNTILSSNIVFDGGYKYDQNGTGAMIRIAAGSSNAGEIIFTRFASGSAGASATEINILTLGSTGAATFTNSVTIGNFTTTQINALTPAAGMVVFNTTLATLCFYDGSGWRKVSHSSM